MKVSLAYPNNGTQKTIDVEDDKRIAHMGDKRMGGEFDGGMLSDEFKGYLLRITGGQDKQGFPMKQGVLAASRVKLLLKPGSTGFRSWRAKKGERRRKSVRGCIVGPDIAILNVIVVEKGESEVEGLTDVQNPRRLGPKRASKIRKLFDLEKEDDVRKFVIKRKISKEGKRPKIKAPKIQRLVTPVSLRRRKVAQAQKMQKMRESSAARIEYANLLKHRKTAAQSRARSSVIRSKERAIVKVAKGRLGEWREQMAVNGRGRLAARAKAAKRADA